MAKVIAISGKGGTGKTTIASLFIRSLKELRMGPVLAVDADPNSSLAEALGVSLDETIGDICEEAKEKDELQRGMTKNEYLRFKLEQVVAEAEGFDLLTMGRPEGPGCYCYANNVLRESLKILADNYKIIVIDNEAGFEHISRKTNFKVDYLLMVADPSLRGIGTAKKIFALVKKIKLPAAKAYLLINRLKNGTSPQLFEAVKNTGLELLGTIPEDSLIISDALTGRSVFELPKDSLAVKSVKELISKL